MQNLDGSNIETLVERGRSEADRRDKTNWCVGVAVDLDRGQIYWTQKGPSDANKGRIFRASLEIPKGESPVQRTVELLFDGLPEPIDLDLDLAEPNDILVRPRKYERGQFDQSRSPWMPVRVSAVRSIVSNGAWHLPHESSSAERLPSR